MRAGQGRLRLATRRLGVHAAAATVLLAAAVPGPSRSATDRLPPITGASDAPEPGWALATLPKQRFPVTRFSVVDLDGERALRVEAQASYGNLVHTLATTAGQPPHRAGTLSWRWRVDRVNAAADLRERSGDDTHLKVCLLFDLALDRVPFDERLLMRLARARTGEPLPAATVCYVWAPGLPADTALDNPYSRRVRYLVLQGTGSPLSTWRDERRDIAADFRRLFGDESPEVPRLMAVAVGADADNTGQSSLAHLSRLTLSP